MKNDIWKVSISYQVPLEHYGCIVRQCDECSWEASRTINGITETLSNVMYLQTLVEFSEEKRRVSDIRRNWEKYAKQNNIKNWGYN